MDLFRPAQPRSFTSNYRRTLLQTVIFWIVFLVVGPTQLLWLDSYWGVPKFPRAVMFGTTLLLVFSLLGLRSGFVMTRAGKGTPLPPDCPRELVAAGPYAIVRNPMAVAGIGQGISIGILFGSWTIIFYALIGAILWHVLVRPLEENDLERRFGEQFQNYRNKVPLWIPKIW